MGDHSLLVGYHGEPKVNLFHNIRSLKVGNPIASILKSNVKGIPALFGLNPASNFMGFTVYYPKRLKVTYSTTRIRYCPDPREDPKSRSLNGGSYKVPLVV